MPGELVLLEVVVWKGNRDEHKVIALELISSSDTEITFARCSLKVRKLSNLGSVRPKEKVGSSRVTASLNEYLAEL